MPTKTTIPFAQIRFFDDLPRLGEVERRLTKFLSNLRDERQRRDLSSGKITEDDLVDRSDLASPADRTRIRDRAGSYLERLHSATGMSHLTTEDRGRLEALRTGVSITGIPTEQEADVLASALHEDMPWMGPATEHVWHAMRRSARSGSPGFRFPPVLLLGPPGIGKSSWARRLGELLATPATVIDATGEPASFALVGSQRGWSSGGPGKVLQTILREKCASPIVIVDEVEKAGQVTSTRGTRFTLTDALLPLLEPSTAAIWQCPYFRIQCDMSWIGWVLTANSRRGLPDPLLSRCPPIVLRPLSKAHLLRFARREADRRALPESAIQAIEECLDAASATAPTASLRTVRRMIDRAETIIQMPTIH